MRVRRRRRPGAEELKKCCTVAQEVKDVADWATRQYIRDFDRLAEKTRTAQELYDKMLELYPNWVNPGWALWSSARAVKPLSQTAENAK
jgi:hypothetical protein